MDFVTPVHRPGVLSLRRCLVSVVLLLAACVSAPAADRPARPAEVERGVRQFREFYLETEDAFEMRDTNEVAPDVAAAVHFARQLRPDGTWADVDYTSEARSSWPQSIHTARMNAMAAAAGRPRTTAADRGLLLAATHRAFAHWIAHDYQCPNWWYNQIGTPKAIGTLALLLGDQLTPEEYRYVTGTSLSRYKIAMTGQNRVWLAGNALMLALLTGDEAGLQNASAVIWNEIEVTTKEGIQPDFSFHQHGPQQQFGNYGMAFAVDLALWARVLRGTPWQMPGDKLAIFRSYLLDGLNWVSWRGFMDISSCGRQFMPHSPWDKTANIGRVMEQAAVFDGPHADAYRRYVLRNRPGAVNDLVGNHYFWRSDYMLHRRPDFAATLKLSSNRVIGAELVNSENLSGYHLGDGALYLYRDGAEYDEIFPVWDWRKLPGVTCAQVPPPRYSYAQVKTDFVGGVSDETDGVCVMDYQRDGVSARKAWFFTAHAVVCLGAGIHGSSEAGIATTIAQCLRRGPVRAGAGEALDTISDGSRVLGAGSTVEHDGWRYRVIAGDRVHLETGPVTGNWHRVFDNPASPQADVTATLFTLWLDHGTAPRGDTYAYAAELIGAQPMYRILGNTPGCQVVQLAADKFGVVFWEAGECVLAGGVRVSVDTPCVVLFSGTSARVVDPTQRLKSLRLTRNGAAQVVNLPEGPRAGTAALVSFR